MVELDQARFERQVADMKAEYETLDKNDPKAVEAFNRKWTLKVSDGKGGYKKSDVKAMDLFKENILFRQCEANKASPP